MTGVLEGKAAIVTGAGSGVGRAIARRFHAEGARVMLADADEKAALAEAKELCAEGERAVGFRCDPASRLDLNNLMAATMDAFDNVDVLVNAACSVSAGSALDVTEADFDGTMAVNVKSAFLLTQMTAKHMIKRAEKQDGKQTFKGAIVNVTAAGAGRVIPSRFAQGVSVAALEQMTRGFAVALAEYGIRVNGVTPGGLSGKAAGLVDPGARKSVVARTPMGRLGEASEVAQAALFLASGQASFITGQVIAADGGRCVFDLSLPEAEA